MSPLIRTGVPGNEPKTAPTVNVPDIVPDMFPVSSHESSTCHQGHCHRPPRFGTTVSRAHPENYWAHLPKCAVTLREISRPIFELNCAHPQPPSATQHSAQHTDIQQKQSIHVCNTSSRFSLVVQESAPLQSAKRTTQQTGIYLCTLCRVPPLQSAGEGGF